MIKTSSRKHDFNFSFPFSFFRFQFFTTFATDFIGNHEALCSFLAREEREKFIKPQEQYNGSRIIAWAVCFFSA